MNGQGRVASSSSQWPGGMFEKLSLISTQITFPLFNHSTCYTKLNANVRSFAVWPRRPRRELPALMGTYHVFGPGTATCSNYSSGSLKRQNGETSAVIQDCNLTCALMVIRSWTQPSVRAGLFMGRVPN